MVGVTAGVMHTVAAVGKEPKHQLGPVIFTTIEVNGVPAKTLIDTGSPATIISLEFVLNVFVPRFARVAGTLYGLTKKIVPFI